MNSQRLSCSQKAGVNVCIKAFWYTNTFVEFIGQFGPSCKHADVYRIAARDGWSNR